MDTIARWDSGARRPPKAAVLVAQAIVEEIIANGLESGARLETEVEMVERFQVSRGTLRESLRLLEHQGVITMKTGPSGGPVVSNPDSRHLASSMSLLLMFSGSTFETVIEMRLHLEPTIARMAAQEPSEELCTALLDSVARMEAGGLSNAADFKDENRRFHSLIAWGSGNSLFGYLVNALNWITDSVLGDADLSSDLRQEALEQHRELTEVIINANPDGAFDAMANHIGAALAQLREHSPEALTRFISWDVYGS